MRSRCMSLQCSYLNWAHCPLLRSELSLWERVLWIYGMWVSMTQLKVPQMLYIHGGLLTSGASPGSVLWLWCVGPSTRC